MQVWTQYQSARPRELLNSSLAPGLTHTDTEAGWEAGEGEGAMLRSLQRQRNLATLSLVQAATDLWRQELEQYQSVRSLEILLASVSVFN